MIKMRFDARNLDAKIQRITRRRPEARAQAIKEQVARAVDIIVRDSHRDTRRFVRGWQLAANDAGIGRWTVEPPQPAKWYDLYIKRLASQERFWAYIVRRYDDHKPEPRRDKWYTKAKRKLDRAKQELDKIKSEGGETAIVVDLFTASRLATVRLKVYGGAGSVRSLGDRTIVILHNLEAHASIVESRFWTVKVAFAKARHDYAALRRMSRSYVKKMFTGETYLRTSYGGGSAA